MATNVIGREADRLEQLILDLAGKPRLDDEAVAARRELSEAACLVRGAAVLWAKEDEAD